MKITDWRNITDLEKRNKDSLNCFISLPKDERNIRDKVFSEMNIFNRHSKEDGGNIF